MKIVRMISKNLKLMCCFCWFFSTSIMAAELVISCPHGQMPFKVALAQTPEECARGLMNREHLEKDEGMLFLFPESQAAIMWMKDTPLSLDMLFINQEGQILAIEENTIPYSLKRIG